MIECLESRIAPAGLIDVSFSHGNVVMKAVTGDAGDESATLTLPSADRLLITPGANVAIRFEGTTSAPGAALALDGFTGKLTASLGGGNDTLTLSGGTYPNDVSIDLGGGANQFFTEAGDLRIMGKLQVRGGSGDDLVVFKNPKLTVDGPLSVASGAGSDTVQFTSAIAELSVAGNVTIAASGSRSVIVEQSITGVGKVAIGGSLKMIAGTGDRVQQTVSGTAGSFTLGGGVTFSATNPTEHTQVLATNGTAMEIPGDVRMTSRALASSQTVSVQTSLTTALGGRIILTGGTAVILSVDATLADPVSITTSTGRNASVSVGDTHFGGSLRIATKEAFGFTASIALANIEVDGDLTITGGIGATTLRVNQTHAHARFTATLGDGANRFLIEQDNQAGASTFDGFVELTGGIDADTFLLGGTGNDAIQFLAAVIANGRGGTDTLTEGAASTHPSGLPLIQKSIP